MKMQALALGLSLFAAGCQTGPSGVIGKPNPASQYCVQIGGEHEVRREANGEAGYCRLPDGRFVDEWELYRSARSTS